MIWLDEFSRVARFTWFYDLQFVFSILDHACFLFFWDAAVFDGVAAHANIEALFKPTVLTAVSVHSQDFTRATFGALSVAKVI